MRLFTQVWREPEPEGIQQTTYQNHKSRLNLTPEQRLMLDSVPMVPLPRWFFVAIKRQIEELCDPETARQVYYRAGWEGATKWVQVQMDQAGLSGRAVLEQYMNSASLRGWGRLKITEYDEDAARVAQVNAERPDLEVLLGDLFERHGGHRLPRHGHLGTANAPLASR